MGDYNVPMQFDIDAEPDVVRRALETEDGIRAWWSKRTALGGEGLNVSFPDVPQPFAFDVRNGAGQLDWVTGGFPPWWAGTTSAGSSSRTLRSPARGCTSRTATTTRTTPSYRSSRRPGR